MNTAKKWMALLLSAAMLLTMAGCSGGDGSSTPEDSSTASSEPASSGEEKDGAGELLSDLSTALAAQGREYGETFTIGQDEVMHSTFFDLKINSVRTTEVLDDYVPNDENDIFVIVNVTVTNTFEELKEEPIPMYYSDFQLTYDGLEEPWFAEAKFTDGQFEDEYDLDYGSSATGDVIFVVARDAANPKFLYVEYWDDEFVGNTYEMTLEPWA